MKREATAEEKEYLADAARVGCLICLRLGFRGTPAQLHHPRTGIGAGRRAPHADVIPLCPEHHQGATGVHGLGRKAFEERYGVTEEALTYETQRLVRELRRLDVRSGV